MASEVQIDSLWTLQGLRDYPNQPSKWGIYVNHIPLFESRELRDLFYDSSRPNLQLRDYPHLQPEVETLVREVREKLPEPGSVEGFDLTSELAHINHHPTGEWQGQSKPVDEIKWTRKLMLKTEEFDTESDRMDASELSDASRAAIQQLDSITIETAYRRFSQDLSELEEISEDNVPPPEKIDVFVAYRRTHQNAALRLHDIVQRYAEHSIFSPYIDHHDMESGDWTEQIFNEIEASDVFMPLVTDDYAEEGAFGREEYQFAKEVADSRELDDFFTPIFVNSPDTEIAQELLEYHGLMIDSTDQITPENEELDRYLSTVVTGVLPRI